MLRKEVVAQVAKKMNFDIEKNGSWHNDRDAQEITYEPKVTVSMRRAASHMEKRE